MQVERTPSVLAVSPMVAGPAFATRGTASKSVALLGIEPERYENVVKIREYMIAGDFRVQGTDAVIGIELAKDLGATVGDKIRLATAENRDDVVTIAGIFDIGVKDLNRRWVFITIKLAQNLLEPRRRRVEHRPARWTSCSRPSASRTGWKRRPDSRWRAGCRPIRSCWRRCATRPSPTGSSAVS